MPWIHLDRTTQTSRAARGGLSGPGMTYPRSRAKLVLCMESGNCRTSSPPRARTSKRRAAPPSSCRRECSALKSEISSTPSTTASPSMTNCCSRFFSADSTIQGKRSVQLWPSKRQCRHPSLSRSTRNSSGICGTSPSPRTLHVGQGAPAPPQLHARGPSQGRTRGDFRRPSESRHKWCMSFWMSNGPGSRGFRSAAGLSNRTLVAFVQLEPAVLDGVPNASVELAALLLQFEQEVRADLRTHPA
ncbi:hypothetical protein SAMN05192541_1563 [Bradyrhizobium arachidis]|nr:hypothetical protein SAMN05192541_1563 [Bradyrhizobium arachidis]